MIERTQPYVVNEQPGEKYWCACGQSQSRPYCDGSHSRLTTGKTPVRVVIDSPKSVAWCGCQRSGAKPFCDGTHAKL